MNPDEELHEALYMYMMSLVDESLENMMEEIVQRTSNEFRTDLNAASWKPDIKRYMSTRLARQA